MISLPWSIATGTVYDSHSGEQGQNFKHLLWVSLQEPLYTHLWHFAPIIKLQNSLKAVSIGRLISNLPSPQLQNPDVT